MYNTPLLRPSSSCCKSCVHMDKRVTHPFRTKYLQYGAPDMEREVWAVGVQLLFFLRLQVCSLGEAHWTVRRGLKHQRVARGEGFNIASY